ncbi:uncharacterized protein LOC143025559 [Oratosquilla oratoria]|uniref:uncharacterized protein LOC143025559 n=1 Tax=Oratosquilla oratoria TaxID=337810 RepID=UPI003F765F02
MGYIGVLRNSPLLKGVSHIRNVYFVKENRRTCFYWQSCSFSAIHNRKYLRKNSRQKQVGKILLIDCANFSRGGDPKKNYYDVLQITPKATQGQVKQAYYKLSQEYHPDKVQSKGSEDAVNKFRAISEAYEVLGNYQKRRLYDRGMFSQNIAATSQEAEEYAHKFYKSRSKQGYAPTHTGRTPIYDFDDWSKTHYGDAFQKRADAKAFYEERLKHRKREKEEMKSEIVISVVLFTLMCFGYLSMRGEDLDKVKKDDK